MFRKHLTALLVGAVFVGLAAGSTESSSSDPPSSSPATPAEPPKTPAEAKAAYLEQLDRELKSVASFDGSSYRDSKEGVMMAPILFGAWAQMVGDADQHDLSEAEKARVAEFRRKVSAIQSRELPKIRAAWAQIMNSAMWEHDMTVSTGGSNNRTLRLTSAIFASNSNIKQIHETIREQAMLLRFRRMEYRWYRGADDYQYFTIESPPDGAVRQLSGNGFASE